MMRRWIPRWHPKAASAAPSTRPTAATTADKPEVVALRHAFGQALVALRDAGTTPSERRTIRRLPWYLMLGAEGAGKTMALQQSGLRMRKLMTKLAGGAAANHMAECEWWLGHKGVVIDTSGSWLGEEGTARWDTLLELLGRHRRGGPLQQTPLRRNPLHGVIVTVPLPDLLPGDKTTVFRQPSPPPVARQLRSRLETLADQLGVEVPVYVLFTKADLIPGFRETFADLGERERDEILGFFHQRALSAKGHPPLHPLALQHRFSTLCTSLQTYVMARLGNEPSLNRRRAMLEFPAQLQAHAEGVGNFLAALFEDGVLRRPPVFRGAFVTSATITGTPKDVLAAHLGRGFQEDRLPQAPAAISPSEQRKGHPPIEGPRMRGRPEIFDPGQNPPARPDTPGLFLRGVLRSVFQDQHLAGPSVRRHAQRRRRVRWVGGGVTVLATLLALATVVSSCGNFGLVHAAEHSATTATSLGDSAPLESLRTLVMDLRGHRDAGAPWHLRWGLYQGSALYPTLRDHYLRRMRVWVVNDRVHELERELAEPLDLPQDGDILNPEALSRYQRRERSLRAYQALTWSPAKGSEQTAMAATERAFIRSWLEGSTPLGGSATAHLDAMIRLLSEDSFSPDAQVLPTNVITVRL